ncbi:MAG: hypothetical protein ABSA79_11160 [Candidatus Bathyarchaeia archaeon]|jgi:di/tricarboxylate transporter
MPLLKEIIYGLLNDIKAILKEYVNENKPALKKRVQKILIIGIIISVLLALVIALIGSASIFVLIGSLKYLSTFMPAWKAWYIVGLISGVMGVLLLLVLYIIIRKQLRSP